MDSKAEAIRLSYPKGTRIELLSMIDDPRPLPSGEQGTVYSVDDIGTIHVLWDNGRRLGVLPEVDKFKIINA